jgi:hypothetical protein
MPGWQPVSALGRALTEHLEAYAKHGSESTLSDLVDFDRSCEA